MKTTVILLLAALSGMVGSVDAAQEDSVRPNIVLLMADDQGWGETGYNGHPHLKTPVLDEMAASGLRLDRFYAASPVCTPTRASVMTGRHANRSGAFSWNWSIRPEEIVLPRILKDAGYRTAHFGKWHIGAVKRGSPLAPNALGFDESLAHDNFFELDPELSRNGEPPERMEGESSEVLIQEALRFARKAHGEDLPFFIVVWFGSPHDPYQGLAADVALYGQLGAPISHRFAEITAMDRAIGRFRDGLESLGVRGNTLLWFNSDNGITHEGVPEHQRQYLYNGGLKGKKSMLTEGGLLVPCIIEWPSVIRQPQASAVPCVTSDILPTLLDLLDLKHPDPSRPLDGISLKALIAGNGMEERLSPIGFWSYNNKPERKNEPWFPDGSLTEMITMTTRQKAQRAKQGDSYRPDRFLNYRHPVARTEGFDGAATWVDDRFKLVQGGRKPELYDLRDDREEKQNIAARHPETVQRMQRELEAWQRSVEKSLAGQDY